MLDVLLTIAKLHTYSLPQQEHESGMHPATNHQLSRHVAVQAQEALLDVVWGLDELALPGCAAGLGDMVRGRSLDCRQLPYTDQTGKARVQCTSVQAPHDHQLLEHTCSVSCRSGHQDHA